MMLCGHLVRKENLNEEIEKIIKFFELNGIEGTIQFHIPLEDITEIEIMGDEKAIEKFHKHEFLNKEYDKQQLHMLYNRFKDQIAATEIKENS